MAARAGGAPPLTGAEQALVDLLLPVLSEDGLVVEDLRLVPTGRRRVLKVLVDRDPYAEEQAPDAPVAGLSLDEVADVSRAVGERLDELGPDEDPLDGLPYTLEVSSPGVDRPLTLPRHFRRNVGRLVDLSLADGTQLRGRILSATPDAVAVDAGSARRELTWAEIRSGTVQVEFRRPEARTSGGHSGDEEG
jgi:ribosome maturation factor RimP